MRQLGCGAVVLAMGALGGAGCDQISLVSGPGQLNIPSPADAGLSDAGLAASLIEEDSQRIGLEPGVVLGGSCVAEEQCDDGLDCTVDTCDSELQRCRHVGENARCADGLYCNGEEVCLPRLGCRMGPPTSCSDATPCTIDTCDEETQQCVHTPRDIDGDGDPDGNCSVGSDCDDQDPLVSSLVFEICGNEKDDNCDGAVDEATCEVSRHDVCADALRVEAPGKFVLNPAGAGQEHLSACFLEESESLVDLFFEVAIPDEFSVDLVLTVEALGSRLTIAEVSNCGESASEIDCARGISLPSGLGVARLRRREITQGNYLFAVSTDFRSPVELTVQWQQARAPGAAATCDEPQPLSVNTPSLVPLDVPQIESVDAGVQLVLLPSECGEFSTTAVYEFNLAEASDVRLFARELDGYGNPRLSIRTVECTNLADELACSEGSAHPLTVRNLASGRYLVAVSSDGPADVEVVLDVSTPGPAPITDSCLAAPSIATNESTPLSFVAHIDDIEVGCVSAAIDAAFELILREPSDILLVGRLAARDVGSVSFASESCSDSEPVACAVGTNRPIRIARHDVSAGSYRIVVESRLALDATLLAAVRPVSATAIVPGANGCSDVLLIPATGGRYQGTTLNSTSQLPASCDFASASPAPEQLLHFVLSEPRRFVADAGGSGFDVLLNLRQGASCPGNEVPGGCALSSGAVVSFLDLELAPGDYYLQIDGYAGASGAWQLDAYFLDPV